MECDEIKRTDTKSTRIIQDDILILPPSIWLLALLFSRVSNPSIGSRMIILLYNYMVINIFISYYV